MTNKSPFFTICPSFTGKAMISPDTSEDIFTSISGWIFPVAETVSTIVISSTLAVSTCVESSSPPIIPFDFKATSTIINVITTPTSI